MSSIDKLIKAFEVLKPTNPSPDDHPSSAHDTSIKPNADVKHLNKKERIHNLNLIHDHIVNENIRQTEEYVRLLSHSIEIFIQHFDDQHYEQDVQFVAEECLNKTIKALLDTNLGRIQVELCRFIKKNGPEKCFKAALTRFADLSHLIRPQKCRHFAEFLLKENIIKKIAQRQEESIQNIIFDVMCKLTNSLSSHMNEIEIKILLDSFLPNLSNESPVSTYRRVAASCLSIICFNSRNPIGSYDVLFKELTKLINDKEDRTVDKYCMVGVIQCFKSMIQDLAELDKDYFTLVVANNCAFNQDALLMLYDTTIKCLNFENLSDVDISVQVAALECLSALLSSNAFDFPKILLADDNRMIKNFAISISQRYLLSGTRGSLRSDSEVKVLLKSLAIDCVTKAINLNPDLIHMPISDSQYVYDILLYMQHKDEKLKTNVCILIGNLINSVLTKYNGNYSKWFKKTKTLPNELKLETLLDAYKFILQENDNNLNLSKKSILSQLKLFASTLLNTQHAKCAVSAIQATFSLEYSTYNLIKYELVELLAKLDYTLINYATKTNDMQDYIVGNVFLVMLCNNDNKLRRHAANMFAHLTQNLYPFDGNSDVLAKFEYTKKFTDQDSSSNASNSSTKYARSFQYLFTTKCQANIGIKLNIDFVVPLLVDRLLATQDKYETYGIIEALDSILDTHEPYLYMNNSIMSNLLSTITSLISHPWIISDLYIHNVVLRLINSLYTASFTKYLNDLDPTCLLVNQNVRWRFLGNNSFLLGIIDKLFAHVIRLLSAIACCIDNQSSPIDATLIGYFGNSQTYVKLHDLLRKAYNSYKKLLTNQPNDDKFFAILKTILTLFQNIFESSIDTADCLSHIDELLGYLKTTIKVNSADTIKCVTVLIRSLFGRNLTSTYLTNAKSTSQKSPSSKTGALDDDYLSQIQVLKRHNVFASTVKLIVKDYNRFVNNLRHCKYATNDFGDYLAQSVDAVGVASSTMNTKQSQQQAKANNNNGQQNFLMSLIRNNTGAKTQRSPPTGNNSVQYKIDNKFISQHIRSFETIVIISLRQYTTTSFIHLQYNILDLLNELLLLKVNYALLDSEYVFIDYILKQLDYLEQQQQQIVIVASPKSAGGKCVVPMVEHKMFFILLPKIYEFLINLACEFNNQPGNNNKTNNLINMPKLIQIVNNLLASENSPVTHVIPALSKLITTGPRLMKNKSTVNDIQQDMLVQTCLKLINYPQVWSLLAMLVKQAKDANNPDKYNRLSRNIFDTLFAALNANQLQFTQGESKSLGTNFKSLLLLLSTLSTQVYRPIDIIINSYAQQQQQPVDFVVHLTHIYLLLVFSNSEEILFCRMQKHTQTANDDDATLVFIDGLFGRLLATLTTSLDRDYMLLVDYMHLLIHVVATFKHMNTQMRTYVNGGKDKLVQVNRFMVKFVSKSSRRHAVLAYLWQHFLIMCHYNDNKYWASILTNNNNNSNTLETTNVAKDCLMSLNDRLFTISTLIAYCEYINGMVYEMTSMAASGFLDPNDNLLMILFNFDNINYLFEMYNQESCVVDLISKIHRKHALSVLYLQTITQNFNRFCQYDNLPTTISHMHVCLRTIEGLHLNVSADIVSFLVDKYINNAMLDKYVSLIRYADYIICQRIEMLYMFDIDSLKATFNLTKAYFSSLHGFFTKFKYAHRHTHLMSLVRKFMRKFDADADATMPMPNNDNSDHASQVTTAAAANDDFNATTTMTTKDVISRHLLGSTSAKNSLRPKNVSHLANKVDNSIMSSITINANNIKLLKHGLMLSNKTANRTTVLYRILIESLSDFKSGNNNNDPYEYALPLIESLNVHLANNSSQETSETSDLVDIIAFVNGQFSVQTLIDKSKTLYYVYQSLLLLYNMFNSEPICSTFVNQKTHLTMLNGFVGTLYHVILKYVFVADFMANDMMANVPRTTITNMKADDCSTSALFKWLISIRYMLHRATMGKKKKKEHGLLIGKVLDVYRLLCNRFLFVNRFLRITDTLWSTGYKLDYDMLMAPASASANDTAFLNELISYIKENVHILKEYLHFVFNTDYTKRIQYEHEYFNMLTILYALTNEEVDSMTHSTAVDAIESAKEQNKCKCILIKALATWLIKSTHERHKSDSTSYAFVSRNKSPLILDNNTYGRTGYNYTKLRDLIERLTTSNRLETEFYKQNSERQYLINTNRFYFGQMSFESIVTGMHKETAYTGLVTIDNLDINTLLRTIVDYYDTLYYSSTSCIALKQDIYKSTVYLQSMLFVTSEEVNVLYNKINVDFNLTIVPQTADQQQQQPTSGFSAIQIPQGDTTSRQQSTSDQDMFVIVSTNGDLIDDSLAGLTFYSEILCACCLNVVNLDKLSRCVDYCLQPMSNNANCAPSATLIKTCMLHGLLYVVESIALEYCTSDKHKQLFDYLIGKLVAMNTTSLMTTANIVYTTTLNSLIFYIVENCFNLVKDMNLFVERLMVTAFANNNNTNYAIFKQYVHGVERLLLTNILPTANVVAIQKNLFRLYSNKDEKYLICLTLLQYANMFASTSGQRVDDDDNVLELITSLLDRLKLCKTTSETAMYAYILPYIIYTSQMQTNTISNDILNKLITEFINIKQYMYPEFLAFVVYKSFGLLANYADVIQEWCLLSLENFLKFHNIAESIWLITCLLLSISKYNHVRHLFYVHINRYGLYDYLDKYLFITSVYHFQKQLGDSDKAKQVFNLFHEYNKKNNVGPIGDLIQFLQMQSTS